MKDKRVHDEPSAAEAADNVVHILGPADVDVAMTPQAALETAKNIGDAAIDALLGNFAPLVGKPEISPKKH